MTSNSGVHVKLQAGILGQLTVLQRRLTYTLRFVGRAVRVHPSSQVAWRSVIRVCGGGSITIGKHCEIHPFAMLVTYGGDIAIGDHCSVNPFTVVYGMGGTSIGNGVRIATHTVIVPENHNAGTNELPVYLSGNTRRGIRIDDNVWIGAGVQILDGVHIGRNCVVGAGSVVTRSLPADVTAVGAPARIIKRRSSAGEGNTEGPPRAVS
jgi:acetyltransferase-like isoleucine patch superfamily enzyme